MGPGQLQSGARLIVACHTADSRELMTPPLGGCRPGSAGRGTDRGAGRKAAVA
jgi:hypothetical protein